MIGSDSLRRKRQNWTIIARRSTDFCRHAKSSLTTPNSPSNKDDAEAPSKKPKAKNSDETAPDSDQELGANIDQASPDVSATAKVSENEISSDKRAARKRWSSTPESLAKFLARLSPDRDEAGWLYVQKLHKYDWYFEKNHGSEPLRLAQETLTRVERKIDEGTEIVNLDGYIHGVAKIVLKEDLDRYRPQSLDDDDDFPAPDPVIEDEESERRFRCLDICMNKLPPESRVLLEDYFREDGSAKIELRKQLAVRLGGANALRIRIHRLMKVLEECLRECLDEDTSS